MAIARSDWNRYSRSEGHYTNPTMANFPDGIQSYLREQLDKLATTEEMERMIRELPRLVDSIRNIDLCAALRAVSGLMTIPEFQPNLIRLESLTHMLAARAEGGKEPTRELLERWINEDLGADMAAQAFPGSSAVQCGGSGFVPRASAYLYRPQALVVNRRTIRRRTICAHSTPAR